MSETYVREKLGQAVYALATSPGLIQGRVEAAILALHTLDADDFDDAKARAIFTGLMDTATAREATADEGTIRATIWRMSEVQALALAEQIMELDSYYRWRS